MSPYSALAALVVVVHMAFVAFAVAGGLLAMRWPRVVWLHLPAAVWAAGIELSGWLCPLTPLENALRARAGLDDYSGDFVARYLFPVLYPEGLTRDVQVIIGGLVLAINVAAYAWLIRMRTATDRTHPA